jgi:hypothetical protein
LVLKVWSKYPNFQDGHVKVFSLDGDGFNLREDIPAFYSGMDVFLIFKATTNKRSVVTEVGIHPNNGALFASSSSGVIKLLRPYV